MYFVLLAKENDGTFQDFLEPNDEKSTHNNNNNDSSEILDEKILDEEFIETFKIFSKRERKYSLLFRAKCVNQVRKCVIKTLKFAAIRDHLLQKSANPPLSKSSTSSSLAEDEYDMAEREQDRSERTLRETFVKLNFGVDKKKSNEISKKKLEDSTSKKLRKKQNRLRNSREIVEGNNFMGVKKASTDNEMSAVSLIGLRTKSNHFHEPHYEAIRDLAITGALNKINGNSNHSTPEGSPRLHHRKYVLNPTSPSELTTKNKTFYSDNKHPPLPKRNSSTSNFYVDSTDAPNHPSATNVNKYNKEPCYTDINLKNIQKNRKVKPVKPLRADHAYSEIAPRPRRSFDSSDNDASPASPRRSVTPNLPRKFNEKVVVDGSKSDGDLSDSDVLDVPRCNYNRRRSRTGNGDDLPQPELFYAVPDQQSFKPTHRTYNRDYAEMHIKPRPSTNSTSSSTRYEQPTYENNGILPHSPSDNEPAYASPDINITPPHLTSDNHQQPTYENNELLHHDDDPTGVYTYIRPNSLGLSSSDTDSNYNNVSFVRKDNLQYANIDLNTAPLYDNVSSPEIEDTLMRQPRLYSITNHSGYTQIDFQKSAGLKEALNQLRCGDKTTTPEVDTEYKIDLSHIKFTKSTDSKRNSRNLDN